MNMTRHCGVVHHDDVMIKIIHDCWFLLASTDKHSVSGTSNFTCPIYSSDACALCSNFWVIDIFVAFNFEVLWIDLRLRESLEETVGFYMVFTIKYKAFRFFPRPFLGRSQPLRGRQRYQQDALGRASERCAAAESADSKGWVPTKGHNLCSPSKENGIS